MGPETQGIFRKDRKESPGKDFISWSVNRTELAPADSVQADGVRVMKFGGSVLTCGENILRAAGHAADAARSGRIAVVVSALRGVTDRLYEVVRALQLREVASALLEVEKISQFHQCEARELFSGAEQEFQLRRELAAVSQGLDSVARRPEQSKTPAELTDQVVSFGERWSSRLFAAALRRLGAPAQALDSFEFILTDGNPDDPQPLLPESFERTRRAVSPVFEAQAIPVVTGFVAANREGRITTLGRNSSDFSAAIVAGALRAAELTIWTSVDGFFSADPRGGSESVWLPRLSYAQALQLSRNGARVVHPKVFELLAMERVPVRVRNASKPDFPGTWVGEPNEGETR
jgi:aspartokinase/homoserine dehydrogenase 1